jgi:hypothetical protein
MPFFLAFIREHADPVSTSGFKKGGYAMKRTVLLLVGAILISGCGRLVKVPENERVIRRVIKVELSRDDIYDRALEWCAKKLSRIKDDVVVKDREGGRIIARGTGKYSEYFNFLVDREFSYSVTIEAREGRYRVTFENFVVYYDERQLKSSDAAFKFEIDKIRKKLDALVEDLRKYVAEGTAPGDEKPPVEDW